MKKQLSGFSLIELLVVVAILGILLLIANDMATRERQREQVNALTISLAGWLEQLRRSSLLGVGCTATINGSASAGSTIASAQVTSGSTTSIDTSNTSSVCMRNRPLTMEDIDAVASNSAYTLSQQIISFTPRGTMVGTPGRATNIVIRLMPNGPSRCISMQGLLGLLTISKGEECGAQQRF